MKCPICNEEMSKHLINKPMDIVIKLDANGNQAVPTPDAYVCMNCGKVELMLSEEVLERVKSRLR